MSFPNSLPLNVYEGTIDGIHIHWGPNAIATLPTQAGFYELEVSVLKAVTEHLSVGCARRIEKSSVRIMYVAFSQDICELLSNRV